MMAATAWSRRRREPVISILNSSIIARSSPAASRNDEPPFRFKLPRVLLPHRWAKQCLLGRALRSAKAGPQIRTAQVWNRPVVRIRSGDCRKTEKTTREEMMLDTTLDARTQAFLDKFEAALAAGDLDAAVAMFAP